MTGFWETVIAPLPKVENRFAGSDLTRVIQGAEVSLRGWNFPHLARQTQAVVNGGLQSQTHSNYGREAWRFHPSGLFVHRMAFREDLSLNRAGTVDVISALWSMTEIWEFAKRLYRDEPSTSQVRVAVFITGLQGRGLRMEPQYDLPLQRAAHANSFQVAAVVSRDRLSPDASALALEWSARFFAQMGAVGLGVDALRPHQARLLKRQF